MAKNRAHGGGRRFSRNALPCENVYNIVPGLCVFLRAKLKVLWRRGCFKCGVFDAFNFHTIVRKENANFRQKTARITFVTSSICLAENQQRATRQRDLFIISSDALAETAPRECTKVHLSNVNKATPCASPQRLQQSIGK